MGRLQGNIKTFAVNLGVWNYYYSQTRRDKAKSCNRTQQWGNV